MARYKEQVFQQGAKVTSAATGKTLMPNQAQAKAAYGENYTLHSAEADHIVPVRQLHDQLKDNPFLTNEDRREIANLSENFQALERADNASKRDQSNEDFINNPNRQVKITRKGAENLRRSEQQAQSAIRSAAIKRTVYRAAETFHNAGTQVAQYGGLAALTTSGITNIVALIKGEKSPKDAMTDTLKDGAKGAAASYVMGGGITTLAQALSGSSSKIIQVFMKSNVPGQIITGIMTFGGALKRFASGETSTGEFVREIGEKGLNFGAMSYGFAVGGIIGALVGSALTSGLIKNITEALRRSELEHQERLRLIAEREEAAKQERAFRAELETYLREWFRDYRECFTGALSGMQEAFVSGDADGVIAGANAITRKLGGSV